MRIGNVQMREFLVVSAPHVVGAAPGNGCHQCLCPRRSLPLWETLQDKQSVLKLDFSLEFTPLFYLELKLGTEHWAYAGANLLAAGKSFTWFASASFTKCQKWKHSQISNAAAASSPVKWLLFSNLFLCVEGMDLLSLPLMASVTPVLCVLEALKIHI